MVIMQRAERNACDRVTRISEARQHKDSNTSQLCSEKYDASEASSVSCSDVLHRGS